MKETHKDEIEQSSTEWTNVAYKLQTMTGKSSLKIVKLFKYPQKSHAAKFSNKEKIDSIVDVTDYKMQYRNKVVNKVIPLQDVIFFCGHINLKKYHRQPNKIFTFLVCKTDLGKIGKFNDPNNKIDSIYIPPQSESQPFHFNFLLNDYAQYQVKYEISFVIGDDHQIRSKQTICSICEKNLATIYCRDERMHFCDTCSNNHHIEIKLAFQSQFRRKYNLNNSQYSNKQQISIPEIPPHQLQKLNRINSLPLCENHSIKNEYFCLKCQKYVCNICVQKGSHNQNPQHVIKHIDYLYQEKQESNSTISIRIKQKLQKLIENIEVLSSQITQNYEYVKKELTTEFEMALNQLQNAYFDKISTIYSDQIELNMTYQKIEWTKAFIIHQQKYLKPIHYFKLQARYQNQISSTKITGYDEAFLIKPDLDYYVDWHVGTRYQCDLERKKYEKRTEIDAKTQVKPTNNVQNYVNPRNNPENSILKFDSKSQAPKRGELSLLLEKSNIHFFKFKTKDRPLARD